MTRSYTVISNEGAGVKQYFDYFKDAKAFAKQHAAERGKDQIIDVSNEDTLELCDFWYKVTPQGKVTKT